MQPRHRVSRAAILLIEQFEGYRRAAAQLPDGRWTIGHGHTLTARQGAEVSEEDAEALLLYDLIGIAHALNEAIFTPLTQNQFDALASFAFNLGLDNFHQSGVLKRLNEGQLLQAACGMELWRKANVGGDRIVIDALVRRRSAEKTLFLTPEGGAWVPAPSPILRPLLDSDARDIVPLQTPVAVTAVLDGHQLTVHREGEPALPSPVAPDEGPAKAAAEAVAARLSTIFQDSGEGRDPALSEPSLLQDPVPFFLRAPDSHDESESVGGATDYGQPQDELADESQEAGPAAGDLFFDGVLIGGDADEPRSAPEETEAEAEFDDAGDFDFDRENRTPFDFGAPVVQPLPEGSQSGLLTLVALAVLGLVFFGGGIFWATYARPTAEAHVFNPRLVGGLAGIAGIGFFVVAVYLLLDRLGRAAEREARHR